MEVILGLCIFLGGNFLVNGMSVWLGDLESRTVLCWCPLPSYPIASLFRSWTALCSLATFQGLEGTAYEV